MSIQMILIFICYIALSVGGLILFKLGSEKGLSFGLQNGMFSFAANGLVFLGLLCYLCSFLIFMFLVNVIMIALYAFLGIAFSYVILLMIWLYCLLLGFLGLRIIFSKIL